MVKYKQSTQKWVQVILPEVCESLVELGGLLHGQFSLTVGVLQLLRLRLHLLTGVHKFLVRGGTVSLSIRILTVTTNTHTPTHHKAACPPYAARLSPV